MQLKSIFGSRSCKEDEQMYNISSLLIDKKQRVLYICCFSWLITFLLSSFAEIERIQKDEGKEEEKFIDVVINKNMKLGQKVLIPVKQFPKVSAIVSPPENSSRM